MKLSEFYKENPQEIWFNRSRKTRPSVHELLAADGMTAINQNQLVEKLPNLNIPFDFNPTPWKNFVGDNFVAPVVPKDNCNAFLPYNVRSLKEEEYNGEGLYELIESYMDSLTGKTKYLISLYPMDYLVATGPIVKLSSICEVSWQWMLECYIGLFDDEGKSCFLFDSEFEIVVCSFAPDQVPEGYESFARHFTDSFKSTFVSGAKNRTGADTDRAQGYFDAMADAF